MYLMVKRYLKNSTWNNGCFLIKKECYYDGNEITCIFSMLINNVIKIIINKVYNIIIFLYFSIKLSIDLKYNANKLPFIWFMKY